MNITGPERYAVYKNYDQDYKNNQVHNQSVDHSQNNQKTDAKNNAQDIKIIKIPKTDRIEISAEYVKYSKDLTSSQDLSDLKDSENAPDLKDLENSENLPDSTENENNENEEESAEGAVSINAAKLARKLAAAKTQSQVRAVMAEIQSDLKECENGKARGMDVDEAAVKAAERLLQEARQRMGRVEDRKPTPEEEMASNLADLF